MTVFELSSHETSAPKLSEIDLTGTSVLPFTIVAGTSSSFVSPFTRASLLSIFSINLVRTFDSGYCSG